MLALRAGRRMVCVTNPRLAATHDAPRVATELGHTSPQMLYFTYRELVLPKEAERYWKIEPKGDAQNVVAFTTSANP
jgi:hypothetical protein